MQPAKHRYRRIRDIALGNNDSLSQLYKKSLSMLTIQDALRTGLGPILGPHLFIAGVSAGCITLFTDSQVWATRLRFQTPEILKLAKHASGLSELDTVRIRINPGLIDIAEPRTSIEVTPTASRILAGVAATIGDAPLQAILLKLSGNTRKP